MAELMPIFEQLRAKGEVGNAYPMHVGSTSSPTVHMTHANPNTCHWVMTHFLFSNLHFCVVEFFCIVFICQELIALQSYRKFIFVKREHF